MLVSIFIPAYNSAKTIEETVESVLAQTYTDFELVISESNSRDPTREVLKTLEKRDSRIRVIFQDQVLTAAEHWNVLWQLCQGKYIKLLCADDLLESNCLERQVHLMESDVSKSLSFVSCLRFIVNEKSKRLNIVRDRRFPNHRLSKRSALCEIFKSGTNPIGEPGAVLFRKESAENVKARFDDSIPYLIDLDFYCQLLEAGQMQVINEVLCSFRISSFSWSHSLLKKQGQQTVAFFKKLYHRHFPLIPKRVLWFAIVKAYLLFWARYFVFASLRLGKWRSGNL